MWTLFVYLFLPLSLLFMTLKMWTHGRVGTDIMDIERGRRRNEVTTRIDVKRKVPFFKQSREKVENVRNRQRNGMRHETNLIPFSLSFHFCWDSLLISITSREIERRKGTKWEPNNGSNGPANNVCPFVFVHISRVPSFRPFLHQQINRDAMRREMFLEILSGRRRIRFVMWGLNICVYSWWDRSVIDWMDLLFKRNGTWITRAEKNLNMNFMSSIHSPFLYPSSCVLSIHSSVLNWFGSWWKFGEEDQKEGKNFEMNIIFRSKVFDMFMILILSLHFHSILCPTLDMIKHSMTWTRNS